MFLSFVFRMLNDHEMPFLEKVAIRGYSLLDHSQIASMIYAAIRRNVHELRLDLDVDYNKPPCYWHQSMFSCNTLVVIELDGEMILNFGAHTCFPKLKVLKLRSVEYKDDSSAQNLISSCPVLEDLVIVRHEFDNLRTLSITSQAVKKLTVVFRKNEEFGLHHVKHKLLIDASALEYISIDDNVTQDHVVKDLSSTVEAKFDLSIVCSSLQDLGSYQMCLFELLTSIFNVKFLSLSSSTMWTLSHADSYNLPKFVNMTCLELCTATDVQYVYWKLVVEFLKCSPILEVLIFQRFSFASYEDFEASQWDVPNCFLSHLKTIKIMEFKWEDDVEKVRYFLKNAKVLEKMIIKCRGCQQEDLKLNLGFELLMFPRASMACQVEIC